MVIDARRVGPMIAPGSLLAGHLAESSAAAAGEADVDGVPWVGSGAAAPGAPRGPADAP